MMVMVTLNAEILDAKIFCNPLVLVVLASLWPWVITCVARIKLLGPPTPTYLLDATTL